MVSNQEQHLATYAIHASEGGKRRHGESDDTLRAPFELDRYRIIESTAFRRLEQKTQVFAPDFHDHFRTRLTHTLEVAQIARTLAGALRANEALAEAIALAHDLGHPPFGHSGETALNEIMAEQGGFNHNTHSLRVVEVLEHPFPFFAGLNLTEATLNGLASHSTRYDCPDAPAGSVEAQIANVADRIAFDCHDLEDAIGADFLALPELSGVRIWQDAFDATTTEVKSKRIYVVRRIVLDRIIQVLLLDTISTSRLRLKPLPSSGHVWAAVEPLVTFLPSTELLLRELENFLHEKVYRAPRMIEMDARGRQIVRGLFESYRRDPAALPPRFRSRINEQGADRVICDYIAGMTDRYCQKEFQRLCK